VGIAEVVMEFDADEAFDVPSELVAVTVKVYGVEAVSPVIVIVPVDESRIEELLGSELRAVINPEVEIEWVVASASQGESGIVAVHV
jgi:tRNA threonylcarbamoyladenosine modification (KEOPS) complex Cgi121 subunit